jgi:hypothetical protein
MCVFDYEVKVEKYPGGKKKFGGKNQKIKKVFFRRSVDNIRAFPEVPSLRLPRGLVSSFRGHKKSGPFLNRLLITHSKTIVYPFSSFLL